MFEHDEFSSLPTLVLADDLAKKKGWTLESSLTPSRSSAVDTLRVQMGDRLGVLKMPRYFGSHLQTIEDAYKLREQAGESLDTSCVPLIGRGTLNNFGVTGIPYGLFEWVPGETGQWGLDPKLQADKKTAIQIGFHYVKGALSALAPMHKAGLVHRDGKPNNLVFEEGSKRPLWIDLDTLAETGKTNPTTVITPYSAPEVIFELPVEPGLDIFSVAYAGLEYLGEKAVKLVDIEARDRSEMFNRLVNLSGLMFKETPLRALGNELPEEVQDEASRLIEFALQGLSRNSAERPTAEEGLEILTGRKNLGEI